MKLFLSVIIAATFMLVTAEASRNQKREHKQQVRIKNGVKSGSLTKKETKQLRKGQKHIDNMQVKAMSDGKMTIEEKYRIEKAQDRQSKKIYNQKHDEQNRHDYAREQNQQERIANGVKNGSLTKKEAKKLREGQKRVDNMQDKAMADGKMTIEEQYRIEKAQDRQSKKIYNQKHDEQTRKVATPSAPAGE